MHEFNIDLLFCIVSLNMCSQLCYYYRVLSVFWPQIWPVLKIFFKILFRTVFRYKHRTPGRLFTAESVFSQRLYVMYMHAVWQAAFGLVSNRAYIWRIRLFWWTRLTFFLGLSEPSPATLLWDTGDCGFIVLRLLTSFTRHTLQNASESSSSSSS